MIELLSDLHLLRPHWLWLLVPVALLLWWLARRRDDVGSWQSVIDPDLLPYLIDGTATRRRRGWLPLLALGWIAAILAATGPSWQKLPQPVLQKQDALVLALDLSYSMWAQDLAPSRIDRARRKLLDLLDLREEGQTALIAFAGDAHVVTPLTDDHPTIANLLPALDPGMMPLPGSEPAAAIEAATQLLMSAGVPRGRILLVTDGLSDNDAEAVRGALADSGARLSILGVGTVEGAPIPLPGGGFLKDEDGAIVMPKLPASSLRALATDAGGEYRGITVDLSDLDTLLANAADPLDADAREIERQTDTWADMAHWFALPLLPLLLVAFRRSAVYTLFPLLLLLPSEPSRADLWSDLWLTKDQQAARALDAGEPGKAAETFADPDWRGTAAYRAGDFEDAAQSFMQQDTADSWYNRGNALAKQGELDAAIDAYRKSLQRDPGREDAKDNLDLVEAMKRRQEQQQEQQNQDQSNGEQQEDSDDAGQESAADDQTGNSADSPGEQQSGDGAAQTPDGDDPVDESKSQQQADGDPTTGNDRQEAEGDPDDAAESRELPSASIDTESSLAESLERDQAMQQWLRRVPDDPAGLLREKFRYESRKRQRKGDDRRDNDDVW